MDRVHKLFDQIAEKMNLPKKKITFIGVHNRRTDHLEYTKKKFNRKPITKKYFHDAMDSFRLVRVSGLIKLLNLYYENTISVDVHQNNPTTTFHKF